MIPLVKPLVPMIMPIVPLALPSGFHAANPPRAIVVKCDGSVYDVDVDVDVSQWYRC